MNFSLSVCMQNMHCRYILYIYLSDQIELEVKESVWPNRAGGQGLSTPFSCTPCLRYTCYSVSVFMHNFTLEVYLSEVKGNLPRCPTITLYHNYTELYAGDVPVWPSRARGQRQVPPVTLMRYSVSVSMDSFKLEAYLVWPNTTWGKVQVHLVTLQLFTFHGNNTLEVYLFDLIACTHF